MTDDPLEPFREDVDQMVERGIRQAEYANLLATVDWVRVNAVIQERLDAMCDVLHDEFGIREPGEQTILKNYLRVKSKRVFNRKGGL
jgi:hypothetical protein